LRLVPFLSVLFLGTLAQGFPAYYDISEHDQAQAEARQRNLPLAWVGGIPEDLNIGSPVQGSNADLEQMTLATLRDNTVIIFFDGRNMAPVPDMVHAQFHIQDDGPLPNGGNWLIPKVVFTNPEVTQILGRVAATQMRAERDAALNSALQIIRNNPAGMAPPAAPPPVAATARVATAQSNVDDASGLSSGLAVATFIYGYGLYLALGGAGVVGLLLWWVWSRRPS